jgi:hypothetical protein
VLLSHWAYPLCLGSEPVLLGKKEKAVKAIDPTAKLIERLFSRPNEFRDRIRNQPALREHDQIVGVRAIV